MEGTDICKLLGLCTNLLESPVILHSVTLRGTDLCDFLYESKD